MDLSGSTASTGEQHFSSVAEEHLPSFSSEFVNSSVTISSIDSENYTVLNNVCLTIYPLYADGILTKEQADMALWIIFEVIMPIVSITGFIGNLLCVVILFQSQDKNAFSIYLKALIVSDMAILLCGILRFVCSVINNNTKGDTSMFNAYFVLIISFGIGNFAGTFSSFLITLMCVERFVAVVFPFHLRRFFLEKHPRRIVTLLLVIQIVLRSPTMIWTQVASRTDCTTNGTIYFLEYREWSRDIVFRRVLFYFLVAVDRFIPVITVLCMNAGILIALKRRPKLAVMAKVTTRCEEGGSMESKKITIMLIALSAFFLVTAVSNMVLYILLTLVPKTMTLVTKEYYLNLVLLNSVILLVVLNAANDFLIYILSSKRFRTQFMKKYCFWRRTGGVQDGAANKVADGSIRRGMEMKARNGREQEGQVNGDVRGCERY